MSIDEVYRQIGNIAQNHNAQKVILFGSRARGTNQPKSDIDIAIEGCADFNDLSSDLQENLWSLLSLDIVNLDKRISKDLENEIARDGKVIYEAIR